MTDPVITDQGRSLEPVHAEESEAHHMRWTDRLALFLRVMALLSLIKGLYHWSIVCGIGDGPDGSFENGAMPWQAATAFFAVIDLVAAVGLWLAAAWGAVVWLTATISMVAVTVLFPQTFGNMLLVPAELMLLGIYLWLAVQAAREQPA
jgi:fatty acid desaturase